MYLLYVCVCWRPERIAPSMDVTAFAAQSARQLLSVHWMRSALSVTHCLVLSDWLAFLLQGKTGWSGVGLSWPGISRSFHTTSHWNCILNVSAWILKHRQDVKNPKQNRKGFWSSKKCNCCLSFVSHIQLGFFLGYSTEAGNVRPSSSHNRSFCLSKGCIQTSSSPSLCRWRCHMWQLWSKQGVELPACWDSGLFATYRQSQLRQSPSCSIRSSSQQNSYFFSLCGSLCLCAQAVQCWFRTMDSGPVRRVKFQHHLLWTDPIVREKWSFRSDGQKRDVLQADNVRAGKLCRTLPCL